MAIWFNWAPLSPLIGSYVDDGTRDLCTVKLSIQDAGDFVIGLVGTKHRIELIRVATLDSDGNLSARQSEIVGKLIDHTLAVLRLTHDVDARLVRWGENTISIGAHDVGGIPQMKIEMKEIMGPPPEIGVDNIRNVIASSVNHRPLVKLLADSQTPLLPLQYRYLSLYKILELEFREAGRWTGLREALEPYGDDYKALNISPRSFEGIIHDMRDKCAHIKIGRNDSLGILGLDGSDAKIVTSLVKLLGRIIANHLNSKAMGLTFIHESAENSVHRNG